MPGRHRSRNSYSSSGGWDAPRLPAKPLRPDLGQPECPQESPGAALAHAPSPRHFHFVPTSSSWLNLVDRWFADDHAHAAPPWAPSRVCPQLERAISRLLDSPRDNRHLVEAVYLDQAGCRHHPSQRSTGVKKRAKRTTLVAERRPVDLRPERRHDASQRSAWLSAGLRQAG